MLIIFIYLGFHFQIKVLNFKIDFLINFIEVNLKFYFKNNFEKIDLDY
jgi:hypothetical protein